MSFIVSPNMNLPVPVVGNEPGPNYAIDVNNCLSLLDQHDHTPGSGVQITPNGMDINTNLTFNGNFAVGLAGSTYETQVTTPANQTVHVEGVDLYYVDGVGNNIQITSGGGVVGTPGSITGLVPPASATYIPGNSTFVWQSNVSIAANMDAGSILMRNLSPNSTFALTLSPPAGLSSNYTITLPVLPASTKFLRIDNTGAISAVVGVDNSTIVISSNDLQVPNSGIGTNQIANAAVTAVKLASGIQWTHVETFIASGSVVVPAGVTLVHYEIQAGGGGGGGGGAGSGLAQGAGGGGGGGQGGSWANGSVAVTPGETITVTVGAAGAAGLGVLTGNGTDGTSGGNSIISSPTLGTVTLLGGGFGAGGGRSTATTVSGSGGANGSVATRTGGFITSSGAGGVGQSSSVTSTAGAAGQTSIAGAGGTGGTTVGGGNNGGGGGGGGASFYGAAGNGGDGGNDTPVAGTVAVGIGAGGGGGGGAGSTVTTGANGGAGKIGQVVLYWVVPA